MAKAAEKDRAHLTTVALTDDLAAMSDYVRSPEGRAAIERASTTGTAPARRSGSSHPGIRGAANKRHALHGPRPPSIPKAPSSGAPGDG